MDSIDRFLLSVAMPTVFALSLIEALVLSRHNPLRIEFREWDALLRDLARARTLRAPFGAIFMPPGWHAEAAFASGSAVQAPAARP